MFIIRCDIKYCVYSACTGRHPFHSLTLCCYCTSLIFPQCTSVDTHTHNHFSVPTYLHICHRLQDIQLKRPGTYGGREGKRKSKEGRCKDAGCTDEWPGSGPIVFRVTSLFLSEPFRGLSSPAGGVLHKHDSLSTQKKIYLV